MYKVHDRQSLENMKLSIYVGKHVLCVSDLNTCMVYVYTVTYEYDSYSYFTN